MMAAVIGVVLLGFAAAGGGYAWWNAKQNADAPVWSVLPLNPELSADQLGQVAEEVRSKLADRELLATIAKQQNITHTLKLGSDAAAAEHLLERLFVRTGEADTGMGRTPAVLIGFNGTRREFKPHGAAASALLRHIVDLMTTPPEP
jgi:hypothetical protein